MMSQGYVSASMPGALRRKMDHGGASDAEFEIAADRTFDADGMCEFGDRSRRPDAAGFADVDRKHIGRLGTGEHLCIFERVDAFVGNDRHRTHCAGPRPAPSWIAGWHRLLGEIDLALSQRFGGWCRSRLRESASRHWRRHRALRRVRPLREPRGPGPHPRCGSMPTFTFIFVKPEDGPLAISAAFSGSTPETDHFVGTAK